MVGGAVAGKAITSTALKTNIAKILNTLGKKEMGALESYIKSGGADAVGKRVLESVMEKATKATPLTPPKTLNPSPKNTPLLTSAQKEAQARVQRYFRNDEIGTKFVKNITTEDGYKALGMYKDKLITFAKNPSKNTIDHEAFHAYFDIALGKQEKNSFLGLVQKRQNLASKIDAEEWMADTFADFVAGREAQTELTGKIKTLFQDLAYRFKNFFGKADKVEGLFRELEAIGKGKKLLKPSSESLSSTAGLRYKVAGDTPLKPSRKLKPLEKKVENIDIQKYQNGDYHQKLEMRNQYFKQLTPTQKKVVQEF